MNRVLALLLTLGCMTAASAQAQEGEEGSDFGRTGWYAGVYGLYGLSAFRDQGGDWGGSGGMSARVGYRANDFFALEADIEWVDEFNLESSGLTARAINGGVNGKFFLSDGRFQPYGLIGAGGMNINIRSDQFGSSSGTDWGFRFAGGIDLYATRNIVIGLEARYNWGVGDVWELDYATFGGGVLYRF